MSGGDVNVGREELDEFKAEVRHRFDRVHEDLKEMTQALRELVRLDGNIKRLEEAVGRIGDEVRDQEKRLRTLEHRGAGTAKTIGGVEVFARYAAAAVAGGLVTAVAQVMGGA